MNNHRTHQRSVLPIALALLAGLVLAACGGPSARESGFVIGTPAGNVLQDQLVVTPEVFLLDTPTPAPAEGEPIFEEVEPNPLPQPPTFQVVETRMDATLDTNDTGYACADNTVSKGGSVDYIGEKNDAVNCEGFWTFNIYGIPSTATVTRAVFEPVGCSLSGSPFSYGRLVFEAVRIGTLDAGDYGAGGARLIDFSNCWPIGLGGMDITWYVQGELNSGQTLIQFRVYMTATNFFGDGADEHVSYTGLPSLIIEYH